MTTRNDLRRVLRDVGAEPVAPVEPRLDDLETRLRSAMSGGDEDTLLVAVPVGVDVETMRTQRRLRTRALAAAAAIVAAVTIGSFVIGSFEPDDGFVIAAADRVEVVLPDGSSLDGDVGVDLPVDARVEVRGSLTVGGRVFGPGEYRVTSDGLVPIPVAQTTNTTGTTSVTTTTMAATDRSTVPSSIAPTRVAPDQATTTPRSRPTTTASERVTTTEAPATTALTRPSPTAIERPTTTLPERPTTTLPERPTTTTRPSTAPERPTTVPTRSATTAPAEPPAARPTTTVVRGR